MGITINMRNKLFYIGGILLIGIGIMAIIFRIFPSEIETIAFGCDNGKTIFRFKNPSKVFPVFISDYSVNTFLTSNILQKLLDSSAIFQFNLEAKNKIIELQEKLNQDNITFSTALKAYFFAYNIDACNESLQRKYLSFWRS